MPRVFPALIEIEDWRKAFMDLLLEVDDLLAPSNLVEVSENTLAMHYRVMCFWVAITKAAENANHGIAFEGHWIMKILDERESATKLRHILQGMRVAIGNRPGSYSATSQAQRVAVDLFLALSAIKAASNSRARIRLASEKEMETPLCWIPSASAS